MRNVYAGRDGGHTAPADARRRPDKERSDAASASRDGTSSAAEGAPCAAGTAGAPGPAAAAPLGALDLGTNNCRLLVARPEADDFRVIDAFSRPVRLGEGMERTGSLSDAAQERALRALRICAAKLRQHRVAGSRVIATEACRRADNGRAFARRVQRETGLNMRVISTEEEARLAVAGCAPLVDPEAEHLLVVDIGGGSTELIWVDMSHTPACKRLALVRALAPLMPGDTCQNARAAAAHIADWVSVPLGVSTLHDRFAGIDCDRARFDAMAGAFGAALVSFRPCQRVDRCDLGDRLQIIGVSGTATTFGALHLGLKVYDRAKVDGMWLDCADAAAITERLIDLGPDGRSRCPGVGRNRCDMVVAGAAILSTILNLWLTRRMRVADRGLREGILYGLMHHNRLACD
ncbi:MAG: Ppx/GppA phosphatase family protein [Pseudomonadota bacterium]